MPRDPEFPRRCRDLAARRIADLGYRVERDDNRVSGLLRVAGAHGRFEIYVACVNGPTGYPMWLERRLALARDHLVMVLLYADSTTDPEFYVVPTEEWRSPQPPSSMLNTTVWRASRNTASGYHRAVTRPCSGTDGAAEPIRSLLRQLE